MNLYRNNLTIGDIPQLDVVVPDKIIIIDDFNSYTNGNLNGQGGWSGHTSFQVQGTTVYEGAKAIDNSSGINDVEISKTISDKTKGIFSIYMRRDFNNIFNLRFFLFEGSTQRALIYFQGADNEIPHFQVQGGSNQILSPATTGVFYKFDIEIDQANSRMRGRMNNGTWTSWQSRSFSKIDVIKLSKASNGITQKSYYDYITFSETY